MTARRNITRTLLALALVTTVAAAPALAAERDRKGLFLGFNAGWGGTSFAAQIGDRTVTDDAFSGGTGALRFGYAFSNSFALSLEGYGLGTTEASEDFGLGAGFLTVTWWPDGSGFFLRLGAGAGGGDVMRRDNGKLVHFEETGAGLFGLGYEWQLTRKFALGVSTDFVGFDLEDATGLVDATAGLGSFSVQFNWYL